MQAYLKKIERYIQQNMEKKPEKPGKGLLAPSPTKKTEKQNTDMDIIAQIGNYVMEIRKKRMELKK